MRILQINVVCGVGSTGRIASDIHGLLRNCECESYIAYGREAARGCDTAIRIGNRLDNYVHGVGTRLFDKHCYGSYRATNKFVRKVRFLNPDIVHLHNIHGYYLNMEVMFRSLSEMGKPVIWTFHDCWPFTGHCAHFDYSRCDGWKKGCGSCPQIRSYPSSILVDNSAQNFARKKELFSSIKDMIVVTPSRWLADLVKQSFFSEFPIAVINNGIDIDVFRSVESSFRESYSLEDKFVILGVANHWSRSKGFDYFISMSRRLRADEMIVLVGLKENQVRHVPKNIIGIPRTDSIGQLAEIYSAADVFVNPTLQDNFPTTNLEALACGTPVITFDTGGSGESVDSNCGSVVKQGNVDALMCSIEEVKRKGKSSYSGHARNRAVMLYDKNVRFHDYLDLYKAVLAGTIDTRDCKAYEPQSSD